MKIWIIICLTAFGCFLLQVEAQESCETINGIPSVKTKNIGKVNSPTECAESCKDDSTCLLWEFNKKKKNCKITKFKVKGNRKTIFGVNNCSPPTSPPTCPPPTTEQPTTSESPSTPPTTESPTTSPPVKCGTGWTVRSSTGSCYQLLKGNTMDWTTAKDTCEALAPGAELASIRDREENSFVKGMMGPANNQYAYWLGGTDVAEQNVWRWTDGSLVNYTNWIIWAGNAGQDCMLADSYNSYDWNDFECYKLRGALCKIP